MSYQVEWQNSEGEHGYADGSEYGKVFDTLAEAHDYAREYARAVGEAVRYGSSIETGHIWTTTKRNGYSERVLVVTR